MNNKDENIRSQYRPELDGLKAFAVITVIVNHFNKNILPSGYLGVDIFFVISGYLITSSLVGREYKSFFDFISGFYERRLKRLLPALVFFVFINSILICLFNPQPEISLKTGLTSIFGVSNLYLISRSTDYFAQSTDLNVFTHTWSLAVEEQFYILFPFILWFAGFGRKTKNYLKNLFFSIGILSLLSLILFLYQYPINTPFAYFSMPSRFWEIASGSIIFILLKGRVLISKYSNLSPQISIWLIISLMFLPTSMAQITTIFVVILSCLIIVSLKENQLLFSVLKNKYIVFIGKISYSLYLWHWGVISISRWTIGIHWWSIPFQVILIFGLAISSYLFIENPFRKGPWFPKRWKNFATGGGAILILSTLLIALGKSFHSLVYAGDSNYKRNLITKSLSNGHCDFRKKIFFYLSKRNAEKCNFGNLYTSKKNRKIDSQSLFFVGSSHSGTLSGLIGNFSENLNANLYSLYVGDTYFPALNPEFFPNEEYKAGPRKYNQNQISIENFVEDNANEGDIVIIKNHLELLSIPSSSVYANQDKILKEYFKNLNSFSLKMEGKGVNIILLGPFPYFKNFGIDLKNTLNCEKTWFRNSIKSECFQSINKKELEISITKLMNYSSAWEKSFSNAYLFKPLNHFCPKDKEICKNHLNSIIYMFDRDHLNFYGSKILSVPLLNYMQTKSLLLNLNNQ